MVQPTVPVNCRETIVKDASSEFLTDDFEDQRETRDYLPEMEKRSYGTEDGRPFRGEENRRSDRPRGDVAAPGSTLPSSNGAGYYLFQGGNGRTFQPYCWYRA